MKNTLKLLSFLLILISGYGFGQDDLLKEIDSISAKPQLVTTEFKALKIVNLPTTKMVNPKELYLLVSHRFGDISQGFDNFFGFDNAITNIAFAYGITPWLSLEVSRSTYHKTYDLSAKYKLAGQKTQGMPVNIVGYNNITINSALKNGVNTNFNSFNQRLTYTNQILISRKFNNRLTLQLVPTHIHQNYINAQLEVTDQIGMGLGGRYKITKRLSINAEYVKKLIDPNFKDYVSPLSLGLDIETGGHVFQLLLSNAQPMNAGAYINNANGNWETGRLFFGFNMYRSF